MLQYILDFILYNNKFSSVINKFFNCIMKIIKQHHSKLFPIQKYLLLYERIRDEKQIKKSDQSDFFFRPPPLSQLLTF